MSSFINNIPRDNLDAWFRWLTIFAIALPIFGAITGGICGWGAFLVSSRSGDLLTADVKKLRAARTLSSERQSAIVDAIRPFAGQRYRAAISPGADDGVAFWESLYKTLRSAGWVYIPPPGPPSIGIPPAGIPITAIPGLEIRFDTAKEQELAPASLALGNAIHADGTVVAVNREIQSNPMTDQDIISIVIGPRVPP